MRWRKPVLGMLLLLAVFSLLNFRQQGIPPLGKFLNPFAGFWQNHTGLDELPARLLLPGLQDTVHILWDDRRVPHIFAGNDHDLYFAQGYLTARDRLWQMEFQTHIAAGRLAEIVGASALEHDRFRRRVGMVYAAEHAVAAMRADSATWQAAEAYARGVNAWISNLPLRHLPLEYKILDYRPEPWTVMKSALLLKLMAWRLTSRNEEVVKSRTIALLGDSLTRVLHPDYPPFMEPIVPAGTSWSFVPVAVPTPAHKFNYVPPADASLSPAMPGQGSNNWAVAGSRTASGYPILCNDPHLTLNLPAIWYEVQLVSPSVNVYGVSLPGAPAVIIGFNQHAAWGVTNAESDVMDWYHIVFQDSTRQDYLHDGAWRPTTWRVEEIRIRGGAVVRYSMPFTHHGPVVYRDSEKPFAGNLPRGAALRWVAHDSSNELATFLQLNRSRNYSDFLAALEHYACPAQNFVFADS
ncbi:MAG: penicillin acylase family protein, partial [candidate division KSB1 bacterium]|nr:penicillin acylase family protein [candidate division KSB1 bacterium]